MSKEHVPVASVIQRVLDRHNHQEHWRVEGQLWVAPYGGVYVTRYTHGWVPCYNAFMGWATNVEVAICKFFQLDTN